MSQAAGSSFAKRLGRLPSMLRVVRKRYNARTLAPFPRENGAGVSFATKASLVYWPCVLVFQMPIPLSVGWDLAAGQGNVVFIGRLDWAADSDVEVVGATMLAFMLGIFLMAVLRHLIDKSRFMPRYLSTPYPHNFGDGFLPASVKMPLIVPFWVSLNRSDLLWRSGMAMPIIILLWREISRKPWWLMGICQRKGELKFLLGSHFYDLLDREFLPGAIFFDLFDPVLWIRDHSVGVHQLTIFLIYRAIQYFEVFHFNRRHE